MRLLLSILFLLSAGCCCAQQAATGIPALYLVTEQNGLSDDHVRCVLKDSRGFVWIGTADGLNIMDGSQITVFRHANNDSATLCNDNINCLAEDAKGTIWIGTGNGLSAWRPGEHRFSSYVLPKNNYGVTGMIKSIAINRAQQIWCGTDGGLFLFDPVQHLFRSFLNTTPGEPRWTNSINNLLFDHRGLLWVCTANGLWYFNTQSRQYKKAIAGSNGPQGDALCLCALEDHNGTLWSGFWNGGLKALDPSTGKVDSYISGPGGQTVNRIIEQRQADGGYMLWLDGPLLSFQPATRQFVRYPLPPQLTAYPKLTPYYRSNDDWIWMGSDNGLYIYNPQRRLFHHRLGKFIYATQGINFMEWNHLLLAGGQAQDFLRAYDSNWQVRKDYSTVLQSFPAAASQRQASALNFQPENDHNVWIGTSDGLLHLDLSGEKSRWYTHRDGDSSSLPRNFIAHTLLDSHHMLWVFPWREGIWQMDSAGGGFHQLLDGFIMQADKKKKLVVSDAVEDSTGNIWMADLDEGVILYNRSTGRFSKPFAAKTGDHCHAARLFYRNGYCYTMIDRALAKWKPGTDFFRLFPLPPEMNKEPADICPDGAGRWWCATRNGLVVFDEAAGIFERFTMADGLVSNDMYGTLFCRANGTMLFATSGYITSFDPGELLRNARRAPNAVLRAVMVNSHEVGYDSSRPLQLDHLSSNLLFRWTITDYSNPFNNRFYCKLQGIDTGWRYVGNKGEIQYANLSPGKYELLLKGVTANGVAAKNSLPVRFIINPPYWQTWWFRALLLVLLAGIVYLVFRLRIRSIRREESVKSAFNKQKAELEMKALRAQMNPHFVFNSLSSIQESIVTGKTEAASKYLSKFSRLIRLILENSGRKFIPLKTEIESLTLYLELESFRFENFTYIIAIHPQVDADNMQIPSMVIQPFVENALKHGFSHQGGDKQLTISIRQEGEQLVAVIEDNGIGRRQAAAVKSGRQADHHSMGMKITEDRLRLLRLQENEKPAIFITDLEDENGRPAGTRVQLILPTEA